jgi:hypothetical protein
VTMGPPKEAPEAPLTVLTQGLALIPPAKRHANGTLSEEQAWALIRYAYGRGYDDGTQASEGSA